MENKNKQKSQQKQKMEMDETREEMIKNMEELEVMMTNLLPMVDGANDRAKELRTEVTELKKKTSRTRKRMERAEGRKKNPKKMDTRLSPWATISYGQFSFIGAASSVTGPQLTIDASSWPNADPHAKSSRMLIQRGVRFSYEDGDVCIRCLSDSSVFVHSLVCNELHRFPAETVIEVPTGLCLKVFRKLEFARLLNDALKRGYGAVRKLGASCAIKLSFGGVCWGEECERKEVTGSPCWIEMNLRTPMSELNEIVRYLRNSFLDPPAPEPSLDDSPPWPIAPSGGECPFSVCTAHQPASASITGSTARTIFADSR